MVMGWILIMTMAGSGVGSAGLFNTFEDCVKVGTSWENKVIGLPGISSRQAFFTCVHTGKPKEVSK